MSRFMRWDLPSQRYLTKLVHLQEVTRGKNPCLVWNLITHHDVLKPDHGWHLDYRNLQDWIAETVILLLQNNPEHCNQAVRRKITLLPVLGVVGLGQTDQRLTGQKLIYLIEKLFAFGAIFDRGLS